MPTPPPEWLIAICKAIEDSGGRAFLVGGCVRDGLLDLPVKDYDIEVYNLPSHTLRDLLERHGKLNAVGEQFAIYKLRPQADASAEADISLPRRESKRGRGHRGFFIEGDPWMGFQEAASRRDFTINAILQDPLTKTIIDPCRGLDDLKNRKLRVVNPKTFKDDSLRVLRATQLSARYDLTLSRETILLCKQTSLEDLAKERIAKEVEKLLLLAPKPSNGLRLFPTLGITTQLFPMLWDLHSSTISDTCYSRESLWEYTLKSIDRGKLFIKGLNESEQLSILLSILGVRLDISSLEGLLDSLGIYTRHGYNLRNQIIALVTLHLLPYKLFFQPEREKVEREALLRLERLVDFRLMSCLLKSLYLDSSNQFLIWLDEKLCFLSSFKKQPGLELRGRDLLKAGIPAGPHIKSLLNQVHELIIEGKVVNLEEGRQTAVALYDKKSHQ